MIFSKSKKTLSLLGRQNNYDFVNCVSPLEGIECVDKNRRAR